MPLIRCFYKSLAFRVFRLSMDNLKYFPHTTQVHNWIIALFANALSLSFCKIDEAPNVVKISSNAYATYTAHLWVNNLRIALLYGLDTT